LLRVLSFSFLLGFLNLCLVDREIFYSKGWFMRLIEPWN
jgi:hypothetical protein